MRRALSLLAVALLGVIPTTAAAAVRYAIPSGGAATGNCFATACTLGFAVSGAANGDQVILGAGTYSVLSRLNVTSAISIEGAPGVTPLPRIESIDNSGALNIVAGGVAIRRLDIESPVLGGQGVLSAFGGSSTLIEGVKVKAVGAGVGVMGNGVTLRDSLVIGTGVLNGATAVQITGTVVGSTIVGDQGDSVALTIDNGFFTGSESVVVRNSILRGGSSFDARVSDQHAGQPSRDARLDIDYSLYGAGRIHLAGEPGDAFLDAGSNNVTGSPALLVAAAQGADVHQLASSPTVNAGSAAAANIGTVDFEGDPRIIGSAPDIGADEFVPAPTVTTTAATTVTQTTATLNASINPNGRAVTYFFDFGTTTSYGSTTTSGTMGGFTTAQAGTATLTGLQPGTTYHFRVTATRAPDSVHGGDLTFTTAAAPTSPPPAPPTDTTAPKVTGLSLTPASVAAGKGASLRLNVSEAATIRVTVDRLVQGRKRGSRCLTLARTGKRCTKAVRTGSVSGSAAGAGKVAVGVPARLVRKKGTYRITVIVTDTAGNVTRPQVKTLRVR